MIFWMGQRKKTALDEVSKLTAAAEQLSMRGEGSEISLELRLPEGISVEFGALPGVRTNGLRMRMITASAQEKRPPSIIRMLLSQILNLVGPYLLIQAGTGCFSQQSSNRGQENFSYLFPKRGKKGF